MSENRKIIKGAGRVGLFTSISRVFGLIRDIVIAGYFGASSVTDAFFVAFRIPNTLRRLFAEGALTVSFIPIFKETQVKDGKEAAKETSDVIFTFLSLILVLLVVAAILFAPLIVKIIAPGFKDPAQFSMTVYLTRITFPYLLLVSIWALAMAVLNSLGRFSSPAAGPIFLNISIIAAALFVGPLLEEPVVSLSIGVLVGGVLQVLLQVPFLIREGYFPKLNFNFTHPDLKRILLLMVPALLGVAVYQLNVFITTTILASFLPEGSVSFLYYADRFFQLPLGIFVISLATAVLPTMSDQVASNRFDDMRDSISFSLRIISFITLPAAAGLFAVSIPIFSLFFQRGEFDYSTTLNTALALQYYSFGLFAVGGVKIIAPAFYAMKDMKTPVWAALAALVVNVILSVILMGPLLHAGLALATTLSSLLNLGILAVIIAGRVGQVIDVRVVSSFVKSLAGALVTAAAAYYISLFGNWRVDGVNVEKVVVLSAAIGAGIFVYALFSFILKSEEIHYILKTIKEKRSIKGA